MAELMSRPYRRHVPANRGEILDLLASIMLSAPTMKHPLFPERSVDTEFFALNESLDRLRDQFGEDCHARLRILSDRMRAHFEADLDNCTDDTIQGRELIHEMEELIRGSGA